jgi:hypothetical protein
VPLLNSGMNAVIERAKPPAGMKNDCAGWQSQSWKTDENNNTDCGQNSRTSGALIKEALINEVLINEVLINEASINEAQINDHRTPEAAQSQRFGNLNSPARERTLTEL